MCSDDDDDDDVVVLVLVVIVVETCRPCGANVNADMNVITGEITIKITIPSRFFHIIHSANRQDASKWGQLDDKAKGK